MSRFWHIHAVYALIALAGVFAFGTIALNRGETVTNLDRHRRRHHLSHCLSIPQPVPGDPRGPARRKPAHARHPPE